MYITANGQPVLSSTHLNLLSKHLPLLVSQTVNYAAVQQANCITVRNGTCPSEAYLLVSDPSAVSGTLSWRARDLYTEEYSTISFQDFKVEHSEKVLPASLLADGVSLVKLVDQRLRPRGLPPRQSLQPCRVVQRIDRSVHVRRGNHQRFLALDLGRTVFHVLVDSFGQSPRHDRRDVSFLHAARPGLPLPYSQAGSRHSVHGHQYDHRA